MACILYDMNTRMKEGKPFSYSSPGVLMPELPFPPFLQQDSLQLVSYFISLDFQTCCSVVKTFLLSSSHFYLICLNREFKLVWRLDIITFT
jgi:hypothetical protein